MTFNKRTRSLLASLLHT